MGGPGTPQVELIATSNEESSLRFLDLPEAPRVLHCRSSWSGDLHSNGRGPAVGGRWVPGGTVPRYISLTKTMLQPYCLGVSRVAC